MMNETETIHPRYPWQNPDCRRAYNRVYYQRTRTEKLARYHAEKKPSIGKQRPCNHCQKLFVSTVAVRRYCSAECSNPPRFAAEQARYARRKAQRAQQAAARKAGHLPEPVIVPLPICRGCERPFVRAVKTGRVGLRFFCCDECRDEGIRRSDRIRYARNNTRRKSKREQDKAAKSARAATVLEAFLRTQSASPTAAKKHEPAIWLKNTRF